MRGISTCLMCLSVFAFSCDNGTTGGRPAIETETSSVNLGLVRSDAVSIATVMITKPLVPIADVSLVSGGSETIMPLPGEFPRIASSGIDFEFRVSITPPMTFPPQPVPLQETFLLRFERVGGGSPLEAIVEVRASLEAPSVELKFDDVDLGIAALGETNSTTVVIVNTSVSTPVTVTGTSTPSHPFLAITPPGTFPLVVAPGGSRSIPVEFAPTAPGDHAEVFTLTNNVAAPLEATLSGMAILDEVVIDLGAVNVDADTGVTDRVLFDVSEHAISFNLEVNAEAGTFILPWSLTGPDGEVFIDEDDPFNSEQISWRNFPFDFFDYGTFFAETPIEFLNLQFPNSDNPNAQLVFGGGTYSFSALIFPLSTVSMRVIIKQRGGTAPNRGLVPLNVFLAAGIAPTAATAENDSRLQSIFARLDAILGNADLRLGDIDYYDITDASRNVIENVAEFESTLELSSGATEERLNLFFVESIGGGDLSTGILGLAGGLPGPRANGTPYSGVMSSYTGFTEDETAYVAAHEVSHYLGLFHTVEESGAHDFIDDTLECDPFFTNSTCPDLGGNYLMNWFVLPLTDPIISNAQSQIILGHAHVNPGEPEQPFGPAPLTSQPLRLGPSVTWCPHCSRN